MRLKTDTDYRETATCWNCRNRAVATSGMNGWCYIVGDVQVGNICDMWVVAA